MDFSLKPNGKTVDVGYRVPNLNNNFSGKAPDWGVLEIGKPLPAYRPRK